MHANDNRADLLVGANAIANHLGVTRRQAYKFIYENGLGTFRIGGTVCSTRADVDTWLDQLKRAA